jgi:hypothetical protein
MSATTGPIIAIGAVSFGNEFIQGEGLNFKIVLATGIAAGILSLLEHLSVELALGITWIALVTELLAPPKKGLKSPVQELTSLLGIKE